MQARGWSWGTYCDSVLSHPPNLSSSSWGISKWFKVTNGWIPVNCTVDKINSLDLDNDAEKWWLDKLFHGGICGPVCSKQQNEMELNL